MSTKERDMRAGSASQHKERKRRSPYDHRQRESRKKEGKERLWKERKTTARLLNHIWLRGKEERKRPEKKKEGDHKIAHRPGCPGDKKGGKKSCSRAKRKREKGKETIGKEGVIMLTILTRKGSALLDIRSGKGKRENEEKRQSSSWLCLRGGKKKKRKKRAGRAASKKKEGKGEQVRKKKGKSRTLRERGRGKEGARRFRRRREGGRGRA